MGECQYYKGMEKMSGHRTKIKCSYMTSGEKIFGEDEGLEFIRHCWHNGHDCPLMCDDGVEDEDIEENDDIPDDIDEDDDIDTGDMNEGQQLQLIADTLDYSAIKCPFFAKEGKLIPYPMIGGLTFKCDVCKMEFISADKLTEWLSHCMENPNFCLHYRQNIKKEEAMVDTVNDTTVSTERRDRAVRLNNRYGVLY